MPPILSKDFRILWKRRLQGFWEEFRRKKIGLFGLAILLFFVGMALLAPWLTPYDPLEKARVAESFAMPSWMTIFPANRDLPPTVETPIDWSVTEGEELISGYGRKVSVLYEAQSLTTSQIKLESNYSLTQTIPPNVFFIEFTWKATNVKDTKYSLTCHLITPGRPLPSKLYPTSMHRATRNETDVGGRVHVDSDNPILILDLGYEPGIDNVAQILFPRPGVYKLVFDIKLEPQTTDARAHIQLSDTSLVTLGAIHGLLGADEAGADLFAQLVYGAQISLAIGCLAAAISTSIGILVGTVAGYLGGVVDETLMRIVDILLCLPILPLLLTLVFLFGKSVLYIVLFVAVFGWQGLSRVIRSQILSLREQSFVECARASGASRLYIMTKHLIPNVLPVAFASLVLAVPSAILFEATLSFLGFGDPRAPTWGKMLHHAFGFGGFTHLAWWWILPPGLAITFLCLAFVFIGHAVDEVVNPRLRRRR